MPRKAKDEIKVIEKNIVDVVPNSKKNTDKEKTKSTKKVEKKAATKKTPSKESKETEKNKKTASLKNENIKTTTIKKTSTKTKKTSSSKKDTSLKTNVAKKSSSKKTATKTKAKQNKDKIEVLEYYDLPYRYNQTIVKVLAQTPTTLFVYWDISDEDKQQYISQYGEYFFNNTKPVLIVYNKTLNFSFEIDINDFANSWYLHMQDSDCEYQIELGRRPINKYVQISNNYLHITTSNDMNSPNDHILFEKLSHFVFFKNIKTNKITKKNTLNLLNKIGKFSSIIDFYQTLYPEENIHFNQLDLSNPSSGNPTSSFK